MQALAAMQNATRGVGMLRRWEHFRHRRPPIGGSVEQRTRSFAVQVLRAAESADVKMDTFSLTSELPPGSDDALFHRTVDAVMREGHLREKRALRKNGQWIPSYLQGRGKLPDVMLSVPVAPLLDDYVKRLWGVQKLGKGKFSGPLYQLHFVDGAVSESGGELPLKRIRVKPLNMRLDPLTDVPVSVSFLYCPENEPVRVRVPIRYINEEKAPGLREGGWLNRLQQDVDINVAPFTRAPLYVSLDVAGMKVTDKKSVGDLQFEGKGMGCRAVLDESTTTTIISKA